MRLTGHAIDRCAEFGITLDVVERIIRRPSVTRSGGQGRTVSVSDDEPRWAVISDPAGVVVTVVPRTAERWEHTAERVGPRTYGIVDTDAYLDVEPVVQPPSKVTATTATTRRRARAAVERAARSSIDPRALIAARRLARGNLSLVVPRPDLGVVYVANTPQAARRMRLA